MSGCLLARFRPTGPWRAGPATGARDRVDLILHSDTLYSAVSAAMQEFGWLDEWLTATARHPERSQVRFSSLFPWQGDLLYVPGPRTFWPPAAATRLRAHGAQFIPATLVASLIAGHAVEEEKWQVDGISRCLLPAKEQNGPFRIALRSNAAVDRLEQGSIAVHQTACLEFAGNSGLWCVTEFVAADAELSWSRRLEACFRLLADSGMGGERSRGWGGAEIVEMRAADSLGQILSVPAARETLPEGTPEAAYWLLSLFSPAAQDAVDWQKGSYALVDRAGRVESRLGWGVRKKMLRMVTEGSVVLTQRPPIGAAPDVAPDGFPHPVYQAGFALALEVPWRINV